MTYNIRTNGEIWDVILNTKQVVIENWINQLLKKLKKNLSIHPDCKLTPPAVHLSIFKIVTPGPG